MAKDKFKRLLVGVSGDFMTYSRPELLQLVMSNLNLMRNNCIFRVAKSGVTKCVKVERLGDNYLISEFYEPSMIGAGELTARLILTTGEVEAAADFITGVLNDAV